MFASPVNRKSVFVSRILFTVHKFFPSNKAGTEVLTLKIAQELKERGHEILVVSADPPAVDARHARGPEFEKYEYEGINVHAIGESLRLKNYTYEHEYYHPEIGEHFEKILEEFRPDLMHIMHAQNLSSVVIEKARQKQIRVILSPTDFWFICPIVQLKRTDGTICEGPGPGARYCMSCYTPELLPPKKEFADALASRFPVVKEAGLQGLGNLLYPAYILMKKKKACDSTRKRPGVLRDLGNQVDAICVPTEIMKTLFVKNGFRESLIHKIPFGIDTSKLESFQEKKTSSTLRVAFIGTIYEHKGLDILIKAFQQLDPQLDIELKIYGSLEQFPEYGAEVKELSERSPGHLEKIKFKGTFPNEKLGEVLTEVDVLVVPSRWYENTPLVIQSALATKTPLVVTNLGGMSELVKDGINGLTFELNNDKDLAEKLKVIVEKPELLEEFRGNIGQERTIIDMVDDLEKLYFPN